MPTIKRIRNNIISLASAEVITKVCGGLMYIILARYLGPHDFGIYSVAVSFAIMFGLISGLGIDSYIVKEIARDPQRTQVLFENGITLKLIGGTIAFLLTVTLCFLMAYESQTRIAIIIFSLTLFFSAITNLFDSIFRGLQRMEYSALILIGRSLFSITLIAFMILLQQNIYMIVFAHVITAFLLMVVIYFNGFRRKFCRVSFVLNPEQALSLLKGGVPFIATGVVYIINAKADILLLSIFTTMEKVGIYDAANELFLVLMVFPSLLSQVLYPYFSQEFARGRERLSNYINYTLRLIIAVSLPISFGLLILAPKFIHLFYGQKYLESVIVLQILGSGISIVFFRSILGWVLAAIEKVNMMMWINIYNLLLNVIFSLILIPRFGHIGAAIATITSMIFGTVAVLKVIRKEVPNIKNVIILYVKPLLAVIPMSLFLVSFPSLNVFIQVFIGAIIYLAGFISVKGLTRDEIIILIGCFLRKNNVDRT